MTLTCWWSKIPICIRHTHPRPFYDELCLTCSPILRKVYQVSKKFPSHVQPHVHMWIQQIAKRLKFSFNSLSDETFYNYSPVLRKVHLVTQNYLDMLKVKGSHMHTTYKFSPTSLYDEPFLNNGQNFGKMHWLTQNDVTCQSQNYPYPYNAYQLEVQSFARFAVR